MKTTKSTKDDLKINKKKAPKIVINGNQLKVKRIGRPSLYNQKIADDILTLCNNGMSIDAISKLPGFPSRFCISNWLVTHLEFYEAYIRAKRSQALLLSEDTLNGVNDRSNDVSGELGIPNSVAVQRDRLIFDARRWYLSKLLPKVFGEKIIHEGNDDKPLVMTVRVVGGDDAIKRVDRLLESTTNESIDSKSHNDT